MYGLGAEWQKEVKKNLPAKTTQTNKHINIKKSKVISGVCHKKSFTFFNVES